MFEKTANAAADMGLKELLELLCSAVGADGAMVTIAGPGGEPEVLASAPSGMEGRRLPLSAGLMAVQGQGVQATEGLLLPSATTGWLGYRPGFVDSTKVDWEVGAGSLFFWWKDQPEERASRRAVKASGVVSRFAAQAAMSIALKQMEERLEAMMEKVSLGLVFMDSRRGCQLNQVAADVLGVPVETRDTAVLVAGMQKVKKGCRVEASEALPSPFNSELVNSSFAEYWISEERGLVLRVESHSVGNVRAPGRFWVFSDVKPLWESTELVRSANRDLEQNIVRLAEEVERRSAAEEALRQYTVGLEQQNEELEIARQESDELANTDALTGLANRRSFGVGLEKLLESAREHGRQVALFYLDLDKFKQVNDTLGHERGDELLREVAAVLVENLREEDLIARLGGDEFTCALSVSAGAGAEAVIALAEKLYEELRIPVAAGTGVIQVSATIGVAVFPDDAENATALLMAADNAMYAGKKMGGNEMTVFSRSAR